ncbi:hypothetical protein [Aneurinibacillus terranovensis]|uniref:hypothetical protein n=1 Tax=Aneurinibacillus terranovensis TaxID=278991 RepID=UPI00040B43EF|nr:hypothetical protein [Aneurinibacillus terranovensis]
MEVYGLYGPSGTGKSTSALAVAHKYNIPAIIDDGLLIYKGRKISGTSAKYEKTTIQAVKRAIFFYEDHAREVKNSIHAHAISRILLIGTSKKMVDRIAEALDVGPILRYVSIDEIRSSSEIRAALYTRRTQGKHVIPIPYIQVEQHFFKRLVEQGKKLFSAKREIIGETTIVQPDFQAGRIHVSENVLRKLVLLSCRAMEGVHFAKIQTTLNDLPSVSLDLHLTLSEQTSLLEIGQTIKQRVYDTYISHLNIELDTINVRISKLTWLGA